MEKAGTQERGVVGMFKLSFLGIGPQKTASSWLHTVLEHHPRLALPEGVKETMFFDEQFDKDLAWYEWHFKNAKPGQLLGEIGPSYFDDDNALTRIHSLWPSIKIIINVRNPVERTFSLYRHHYSKGRVPENFQEASRILPRIMSSGHYAIHAQKWERAFGAANVLYLVQEDIEKEPLKVWQAVCNYLQVDVLPLPEAAAQRVNEAKNPRAGLLAKLAVNIAIQLRRKRLYKLVEVAKNVTGPVFYSKKRSSDHLQQELYLELWEKFAGDVQWLENRLNRSFSNWAPDVRHHQHKVG